VRNDSLDGRLDNWDMLKFIKKNCPADLFNERSPFLKIWDCLNANTSGYEINWDTGIFARFPLVIWGNDWERYWDLSRLNLGFRS